MELSAVVAPLRGMVIAAAATLAVAAPVSIAPTLAIPAPAPCTIDEHRLRADHLAWTIEHRRYGEIEAAAAAIGADSPYAGWVPAAIGLAIEQLDATAAAHAAMHRCSDLHRFLRRIAIDWPAGRAAMKRVRCDGDFVCGAARSARWRAAGTWAGGAGPGAWEGAGRYHHHQHQRLVTTRRMERYTATRNAIAEAVAAGDDATALARCGDIRSDGPMVPACVAAACRAGNLPLAETLAPFADADALRACGDVGVTFSGGFARSAAKKQPVELVYVHPDAPARDRALW